MSKSKYNDVATIPFTAIRSTSEEERLTGERLRDLVFEENERLNRLIRNLYLKFRLERYPEAELFDHICRELAQYFHTDACSLFLIRHERTQSGLKPYLKLVGAFGPWQAELYPQKVRQKQIAQYDIENLSSLSTRAYHRGIPTLLPSRQDFEMIREVGKRYYKKFEKMQVTTNREDKQKQEETKQRYGEAARHLVWRYTNLYYTCRNMLWIPIMRKPESGLTAIGLLKIENRTPRGIRGFSLPAGPRQLFFKELWGLAALKPYLIDLCDSEDVFVPVHDNEAWRLRYQDNPLGLEYFDSLRIWLKKKEVEIESKTKSEQVQIRKNIREGYINLNDKLNWLLRFLSEAEILLQNIAYAHAVLVSKDQMRYIHQGCPPAPSFFNAHNLALAIQKAKSEYKKEPQKLISILSNSAVDLLKQKLKEHRIIFPEEGRANHNGTQLPLIRKVMKTLVGHETLPTDISSFLGEPLRKQLNWNFQAAAECLLQYILDFAKTLREAPVSVPRENNTNLAEARLLAEQKVACRLADEILRLGNDITKCVRLVKEETRKWALEEFLWLNKTKEVLEKNKGTKPCVLSENELNQLTEEFVTQENATLLLFSRWSAKAGMCAHTFDETDVYRLMFIAGHVCQVLDTNLMQQARQRRIPIGYSDIALLGIGRDSLVWLNDLKISTVRIAQTFEYKQNRDMRRQIEEVETILCEPLDLKETFHRMQDDIRVNRNKLNSSVEITILRVKGVLPTDLLSDKVLPDKYPTFVALKRWLKGNVKDARNDEINKQLVKRIFHRDDQSIRLTIPLELIVREEPLWLLRVQETLNELEEVLQDV